MKGIRGIRLDATPRPRCLQLLAAIVLLLSSPVFAQESIEDIIERVERSVVRIETDSEDGGGVGSGFVVDDAGTIVTNYHVIAGAKSATAFFPDGRQVEFLGTLLVDETRDIAVARLATALAPAVKIIEGLPRKGERVIALGAPFGLSFTATNGIVSAIRSAEEMRSDMGRSQVMGTWIQVDAPLSPGNSGGPLINIAGEVVAMSTLASGGGRAQNLNFGISARDIRNAIKYARDAKLLPLSQYAASLRLKEGGPPSRIPEGTLIRRKEVPPESIGQYIGHGLKNYDDLLRGARAEIVRLNAELKEMRKGNTYMPPNLTMQRAVAARVKVPGSRDGKWFFASSEVKESVVGRQLERIKELRSQVSEIKSREDQDSIYQLLQNFGRALEPRKNMSIGFAQDIIVVHALNDHEVLVVWDDHPYLYWAESTAGLFAGEVISGPVMVAGTKPLPVSEDGVTMAVTVLQEIDESALKTAIERRMGYRTWRDTTGSRSIEAKIVKTDAESITLEKRDGAIVTIARSKIYPEDLQGVDD